MQTVHEYNYIPCMRPGHKTCELISLPPDLVCIACHLSVPLATNIDSTLTKRMGFFELPLHSAAMLVFPGSPQAALN